MTQSDKPTISPALRYKDGRAAIDWLVSAFGFEQHAVHAAPDGSIAHAELRVGPSLVGLSSVGPPRPDNPWGSVRRGVYVRVQDVDAHHARAKTAGADIVQAPRNMEYGSREYSVRDPEGHLWGFGTYEAGAAPGPATIFVGLHYQNGPAILAFFTAAFGFESSLEVPGPDGAFMHVEMRFGNGVIMFGSTPRDTAYWGDQTEGTNVVVDNPDLHYARARKAGATIVRELANTPYGARGYDARDPEGFLWGFSNYRPTL